MEKEYRLLRYKKDAIKKTDLNSRILMVLRNLNSLKYDKSETYSYEEFKVERFGNYFIGEAYSHERDAHYWLIGFEVEITSRFDFMEKADTTTGFYPVWTDGKNTEYDPIEFEESYRPFGEAHRFNNGCGDHIDVAEILIPAEKVQKAVSDLTKGADINQFMKRLYDFDQKQASLNA